MEMEEEEDKEEEEERCRFAVIPQQSSDLQAAQLSYTSSPYNNIIGGASPPQFSLLEEDKEKKEEKEKEEKEKEKEENVEKEKEKGQFLVDLSTPISRYSLRSHIKVPERLGWGSTKRVGRKGLMDQYGRKKQVKSDMCGQDDWESQVLKSLAPESYIIGEVIDLYMRYLQRTMSSKDCHFFSSFFYTKLVFEMDKKGSKKTSCVKLRSWWKGNLFQNAYILLPIFKTEHWSLVIVCLPAKEEDEGPILLHLDSFQLHPSKVIFNDINWCF